MGDVLSHVMSSNFTFKTVIPRKSPASILRLLSGPVIFSFKEFVSYSLAILQLRYERVCAECN